MADKLENEVRYFLRPSEDVIIVLETSIVDRHATIKEEASGKTDYDWKDGILFAIVTHWNDARDVEEGRCVFYGSTASTYVCAPMYCVKLFSKFAFWAFNTEKIDVVIFSKCFYFQIQTNRKFGGSA
jgi:hypothetical protein